MSCDPHLLNLNLQLEEIQEYLAKIETIKNEKFNNITFYNHLLEYANKSTADDNIRLNFSAHFINIGCLPSYLALLQYYKIIKKILSNIYLTPVDIDPIIISEDMRIIAAKFGDYNNLQTIFNKIDNIQMKN